MLSFSSQPRFLCPPCEGGHGNLFVQNGPLFVVCLLGFWVGFFSNTAGPWGGKIKRGMTLAFQNALLTEISVLDTALLFICAENVVWWPSWVSNLRRGSVPCTSFVPSFFFGGQGGTLSFSPGWMDTLCSQGVEELLPLGFSGIDDTLWTRI